MTQEQYYYQFEQLFRKRALYNVYAKINNLQVLINYIKCGGDPSKNEDLKDIYNYCVNEYGDEFLRYLELEESSAGNQMFIHKEEDKDII